MSSGSLLFLMVLAATVATVLFRRRGGTRRSPEVDVPVNRWIELREADQTPVAVAVPTDLSEAPEARRRFERRQAGLLDARPCARVSPAVADLTATVLGGEERVGNNVAYQILGPGHLVALVDRGSHHLHRVSDGSVLIERSTTGNGKPPRSALRRGGVAVVPSSSIVSQTLIGIGAVAELRQINERLDSLLGTLQGARPSGEDWEPDPIAAGWRALRDIVEEQRNTGRVTLGMMARLSNVELSIGEHLERIPVLMDGFRRLTRSVESLKGQQGRLMLAELLRDEGRKARLNMRRLVGLVSCDLRIQELLLRYALEHAPADLSRRVEAVEERIKEYGRLDPDLPTPESLPEGAKGYRAGTGWWRRDLLGQDFRRALAVPEASREMDLEQALDEVSLLGFILWRNARGEMEALALPEAPSKTGGEPSVFPPEANVNKQPNSPPPPSAATARRGWRGGGRSRARLPNSA